jgi:ABC-type uncharacterized transport system substrate-binding protein
MKLLLSTVAAGVLAAGQAAAHPHVFVDTGLQVIFDEVGQVAAVRVIWVYDELYTMFVLDDLGLDQDFTGELTPEEQSKLAGFDMNWVEGFEGDLYALSGDNGIGLSGPSGWTAEMREGRIITTHLRTLEDRVAPDNGAPLILQVYDPTYYTAYHIAIDPILEGRSDCEARIFEPDRQAASALLEDALAELLAEADADLEADFPAVGAAFAEEVRLTCPPAS